MGMYAPCRQSTILINFISSTLFTCFIHASKMCIDIKEQKMYHEHECENFTDVLFIRARISYVDGHVYEHISINLEIFV